MEKKKEKWASENWTRRKIKEARRLAGRATDYARNKQERGQSSSRSVIAAEAIITPDFPLNQFAIRHSPLPSLSPLYDSFSVHFFVPRHNKWRRRRAEIIKSLRRRREGEANLNKRYVTITFPTLWVYVLILRPPGLPCSVMELILSKILSATLGKEILWQKCASVSNLVCST